MGRSLRFIHGADLHLGAPFRGLRELSPEWADRLYGAIQRAYDNLVEAALREAVDFVVLAGDIFDNSRGSYGDYLRFFQGLERLGEAGISTYLCTGNHDPLNQWQQSFASLPPRARIFSADHPDFVLHERDGEPLCVLGGRGYPNKVWSQEEDIAAGITRTAANEALGPAGAAAPFGVGVLHTGLHLDAHKAPVPLSELLAAGFDYWALGHIHRRFIDSEADPRVSFSGCIQGRDIKETGPRGVNLVTLAEDAPNVVEFVPTAAITWQMLDIDIVECATLSAVADKVMGELFYVNGQARCEEMVSRVTLTGATPLHETLAAPGVLADLRAQLNGAYADFFVDALIDRTTLPLDKAALRAEGLFPAMLMRTADAQRAHLDEQRIALEEAFMEAKLTPPALPDGKLAALMDEAEDEVLGLLVQEGGSR